MSPRSYTLYSFTEKIRQWLFFRFTEMGRLFVLIACVACLFGLAVQKTMIYQIMAVVSSLLVLSFLSSRRIDINLKINKTMPVTCVAGTELKYIIKVQNRGRRRVKSIFYREFTTQHLARYRLNNSSRNKGGRKHNTSNLKNEYRRWFWLPRIGRRIESNDHELPDLEPSMSSEMEVTLLPLRRGNIHLNGYILTRVDPLGLCKHQIQCASPRNLLVLPKLYSVPSILFPAASRYHQGRVVAAQDCGESNEFLDLREYTHGDPIKRIDWKSTARVGKTIVKQYREEHFPRYGIILDSFTSKRFSNVFEEAVSVAASIMMAQDTDNSVLDLFFVEGDCLTHTVGAGFADKQRLMETLASATTCRDQQFDVLAGLVKNKAALFSGIILILIDMDEQRSNLINYLAGSRIPVKPIVMYENMREYGTKKKAVKIDIPLSEIDANQIEEQLALL